MFRHCERKTHKSRQAVSEDNPRGTRWCFEAVDEKIPSNRAVKYPTHFYQVTLLTNGKFKFKNKPRHCVSGLIKLNTSNYITCKQD